MEERGDTAVQFPPREVDLAPSESNEVVPKETGDKEEKVSQLPQNGQHEEEAKKDKNEEEEKSTATTTTPTTAATVTMETKKAGIDCSLLQLFKCQYFDMWLTIWYLNKYSRNVGVTDYLSNHLYSYSIHEIQFYLPQICVLLLNGPPTQSLEKFLLDTCSSYMHIAFQAMWHLQAYIDTFSTYPSYDENKLRFCLRLHESVEAAVVNGITGPEPQLLTLPPNFNPPAEESKEKEVNDTQKDPQKEKEKETETEGEDSSKLRDSGSGEYSLDPSILRRYLSKKRRSEYFDNVTHLINSLVQLSDKVMQVPPNMRQEKLRSEVTKINDAIPDSGLYVPIDEIRQPHTCIVRIPPNEAFLLDSNSKTHSTYIIYTETVLSTSDCSSPNIHLFSRTPYTPSPLMLRRSSAARREKENDKGKEKETEGKDQDGEKNDEANETKGSVPASRDKAHNSGAKDEDLKKLKQEREKKEKEKRAAFKRSLAEAQEDAPFPGIPLYIFDGEAEKKLSPEEKDKNEWKYISEMEKKDKAKGGAPREKGLGMELHASFAEDWESKSKRIQNSSPHKDLPGWVLRSLIVKYDECRQELLAAQLISQFQTIFNEAGLALPLYPMSVLVVSSNCGLIETLPNAISLHQLHKHSGMATLLDHFKNTHKDPQSLESARLNFCQSLAAYSVVTYLLQVKDRHNGNILLLKDGKLIHIDFGYFLSNSPRNLNFESAPFKLTQEFVDVLGGLDSDLYHYFKSLVTSGFLAARKHMDKIILLVEIALKGPPLPCLATGEECVNNLRERFQRGLTEEQFIDHVEWLINTSLDNFYTRTYDKYQYLTRGILY